MYRIIPAKTAMDFSSPTARWKLPFMTLIQVALKRRKVLSFEAMAVMLACFVLSPSTNYGIGTYVGPVFVTFSGLQIKHKCLVNISSCKLITRHFQPKKQSVDLTECRMFHIYVAIQPSDVPRLLTDFSIYRYNESRQWNKLGFSQRQYALGCIHVTVLFKHTPL